MNQTTTRPAPKRAVRRALPGAVMLGAPVAAALILASGGAALAAPTMVVGKLTRQYLQECTKQGKTKWVAPHFQIGFFRVVPVKGVRLAPLVGKTVVAHGSTSEKAIPALPLSAQQNCPGRQMRGDWVIARGGMRVQGPRPGLLERVKTLHATRVSSAKLLWLDKRNGRIRVRLRNGLSVPLPGLMLHARYERCIGWGKKMLPGKPMPASETRKLGTLAARQRRTLSLPLVKTVLPARFKKTHALREVYLYSAVTGSLVDLSRELQTGLDRTCR